MKNKIQKILWALLAVFGIVLIILLFNVSSKIGSLNKELKELKTDFSALNDKVDNFETKIKDLETKVDKLETGTGETPTDPTIPVVPLEVVAEDGLTLFDDYLYVGYGFVNGTLDDIANIKISAYNGFDMIVATANSNVDKFAEHQGATSFGCAIYFDETADEYWNCTYFGAVEKTTYVKISVTLKSGAKANLTIAVND